VADSQRAQIADMQDDMDNATFACDQCRDNAIRLTKLATASPPGPTRDRYMAAARQAKAMSDRHAKTRDQLLGKISTLEESAAQLRGMESNIQMTKSMDRGNKIAARLATEVGVDKVHDVMDAAAEHKSDYNEVADALSGKDYLDQVDPEDADAELMAMTAAAVYNERAAADAFDRAYNDDGQRPPQHMMDPRTGHVRQQQRREDYDFPAAPRHPVGTTAVPVYQEGLHPQQRAQAQTTAAVRPAHNNGGDPRLTYDPYAYVPK